MSEKLIEKPANTAQVENMLAKSGYSEKAIRYFVDKPNMGTIPDADHVSEMTGSCGDTMSVCIKIEKGVVREVKYQVLGCPGAVASAMAAADLIRGKTIEEACKLNDGDVFRLLEEIPAQKHHCIQLAVKTLQKALSEYEQRPSH
ncbi:MAG: iron-sulfur cluster assembly scaffold protein [Syntrophobacteraceae bacterium]